MATVAVLALGLGIGGASAMFSVIQAVVLNPLPFPEPDRRPRAATALRLAARGLTNSKSALGAFYRRLRARIGAPKAITAAAYKIAKLIYRMLETKRPYHDLGQAAYDERFRARRLRSLARMAQDLGFTLVPVEGP